LWISAEKQPKKFGGLFPMVGVGMLVPQGVFDIGDVGSLITAELKECQSVSGFKGLSYGVKLNF
jgi:hypothetical protein